MAGLVPAIHVFVRFGRKGVDARHKAGHDGVWGSNMTPRLRLGVIAAIAVLLADQASKLWLLFAFDIAGRGAVSVTPFFDLVLAWNTGISYGWFQTDSALGHAVLLAFKILAVIVLAL